MNFSPKIDSPSIYSLRGVGRTFGDGDRPSVALQNITLDIPQGDQVVLLGPSGSGKTTLFRLLNASIFPSAGKLLYRTADVSSMGQADLRQMRCRIGCIYQQHYLVPGMSALMNTLSGALGRWGIASTVRNLVTPKAAEVERAEHCLEAVGLKEKWRSACSQLSGGQQQRLAIARTLMQQPEVILADEPVASLDPVLSDEILDLLVRLAEDSHLTLLISLHQVELARRHSKRVVGLRTGEVAFDLPTSDLEEKSLTQLYHRSVKPHEPRELNEPHEQAARLPTLDPAGGPGGADDHQKRACLR
ncbi:MAG TPA: phosphonate ABC transporter ATP-binding protein [Acidisarcina sp.]